MPGARLQLIEANHKLRNHLASQNRTQSSRRRRMGHSRKALVFSALRLWLTKRGHLAERNKSMNWHKSLAALSAMPIKEKIILFALIVSVLLVAAGYGLSQIGAATLATFSVESGMVLGSAGLISAAAVLYRGE